MFLENVASEAEEIEENDGDQGEHHEERMEYGRHVHVLSKRERLIRFVFVVEHQLSSLHHRRIDHPERHIPAASRVRCFLEAFQLWLFDGHLLLVELGKHSVANLLELLVVAQRFEQRKERTRVDGKAIRIARFNVALDSFDFNIFVLIFQVDRSNVGRDGVEAATADDVEAF